MCVWLAFQRDFLFYYITIACMDHMIYQAEWLFRHLPLVYLNLCIIQWWQNFSIDGFSSLKLCTGQI